MMLANYIGAIALIVLGFYAMIAKHDIIKIVVGMGLVDYGLNLLICLLYTSNAAIIGRVTENRRVVLKTGSGGSRVLRKLSGAQLPRIC